MRKNKEDAVVKAENIIKSWHLNFTFRGIDLCVNREGLSLSQLRTATFVGDKDVYENVTLAVKYLLMCGIVSDTIKDYDAVEAKALEFMEQWRREIGCVELLHIYIIRYMELQHFFMEGQDVMILTELMEKKQDDLAMNCCRRHLTVKQLQEEWMRLNTEKLGQKKNTQN